MQVITDILLSVGKAALAVARFLMETVDGLAYCVKLTAYFIAKIPDYFSWMPAEFLSIIVLVFSIAVVYKLIGREG